MHSMYKQLADFFSRYSSGDSLGNTFNEHTKNNGEVTTIPGLKAIATKQGLSEKKLKAIETLLDIDATTQRYAHISALLSWDQETMMPKKGTESRSEQLALIAQLEHASKTDGRVAEHLAQLEVSDDNPLGSSDMPLIIRCWVRALYRGWKIAASVPPALIAETERARSRGLMIWIEARKQKKFTMFKDSLKTLVDLRRQYADCVGYEESPYDALLNEFEPELKTHEVKILFKELKDQLLPLYKNIEEHTSTLAVHASEKAQTLFLRRILEAAGYNHERGRLDQSAHPFSTTVGYMDSRITTSIHQDNPASAISSTLHELGHAMYELGVSPLLRDTCCSEGVSLGIHESQSRYVENIIGRSREYWEYWYPILCKDMPEFSRYDVETFVKTLRVVNKHPIRIESDELSYVFHILLRFELEHKLIDKTLEVDEIRDAWNDTTKELLGFVPVDDSQGVLQDVHWAHGIYGYFPTYVLGSIYAATLVDEYSGQGINFDKEIRRGDIRPALDYMKQRIHRFGACLLPKELLHLDVRAFVEYLKNRYVH